MKKNKNFPGEFFKIIVTSAYLFFLSSCVTGPEYHKPDVETPAHFKEGKDWKKAEPKDDAIRGPWWKLFNDPQLNALEDQVNLSNQNIASSIASLRQAQALIKGARAQYYPTINLSPNVTTQKGLTGNNLPAGNNNSQQITLYSIPVEASWVPDLWGRVQNTVKQNVATAQVSAADLENVRLVEQSNLAITYYELRVQDELIQLFDSTITAYQDSLRITQALSKTGIGSDEAVAQAETQLKTTQANATNLKIARAQFEHAIALFIGKPASSFSIQPEPLKVANPIIPLALPSQLLERRPDVAAAERNMAAANARIGIATSAYYPQLSLTAEAGLAGSTIDNLLKTPTFFWSLGASLTETLFDGGARSAAVEQYKAGYDQAVATYRQTVLTAFQQVEDALSAIQILSTQTQEQQEAVVSTERYLQIATSRYKLGLDPYLNVLTAQVTLLTNRQTSLNLRMQQLTASINLIQALGGGWNRSQLPNEKELLSDSAKDKHQSNM